MANDFRIRKVAVLGAGVMGAQIAAHFINANVETLLFDVTAPHGDPNAVVAKPIEGLKNLEPAALALPRERRTN
jgi:3-hydroxyacyl-CoA dehydrogenase